jgi:alpha-1,3-rhamnosyltransferase
MANFHDPLVTIVVVTYNSGATIRQTLASLLDQQYARIEVIFSDDGSTDNTLDVIRHWMSGYRHRFDRVLLLESATNQGLCRNMARAYERALGEWLKPIAGDDFLLPNAIGRYVAFARERDHAVVVAQVATFSSRYGPDALKDPTLPAPADARLIDGPRDALLREMLARNVVAAPGVLIERAAYEAIGGVDLAFTHLEDWPLWINLLRAGKTFGLLEETLVAYRVAAQSLSTGRPATAMSLAYIDDLLLFYRKYQRGGLRGLRRLDRSIEMLRFRLARGALRERPGLYNGTRLLHALSPASWKRLARRTR